MLKIRIIPCLDVKDGRVVKGVNFVDLVDAGDPVAQARVYDEAGALKLGVARGKLTPGSVDAQHMVDGISGATRTSEGVHGLLRFWLGDFGFGAFLERVRRGEA